MSVTAPFRCIVVLSCMMMMLMAVVSGARAGGSAPPPPPGGTGSVPNQNTDGPTVLDFPAQPEVLADAGRFVTLSITVSGLAPYSFQWQQNGRNVGAAILQGNAYCELDRPQVPASSGSYRCIIKDLNGTTISYAQPLHIWPTPTIRQARSRLIVNTGELLEIYTATYSTAAATKYEWQFNGRKIAGAPSQAYYTSDDVTLAQAGGYRVVMGTLAGASTSDTVTVAVVDGAAHTFVAAEGKTATLKARVPAVPGLAYSWARADGLPLPAGRCTGITTATLTITKASAAKDAVGYYCAVTDADGNLRTTGLLTLVVENAVPEVFLPADLDAGSVGLEYSTKLYATHTPTSFSVKGLPSGLTCAADGTISGFPGAGGTFTLRVTASNPLGTSASAYTHLTLAPLPREIVGSFAGLYSSPDNAGVTMATFTLSVTESGQYTGRLYLTYNLGKLYTLSFTGRWLMDEYGNLTSNSSVVTLPGLDDAHTPVTGHINLVWDSTYGLLATLPMSDGQTLSAFIFQSQWNARTNPATQYKGYHTVELPNLGTSRSLVPDTASGSGYAVFTVSAGGTFTFTGRLPDGTAFAIPSFVDPHGNASVHVWLYGYKGMLTGNLGLTDGTAPGYYDRGVGGRVVWTRPAATTALVRKTSVGGYFAGVDTNLGIIGAKYLPPALKDVDGPLMMEAPDNQNNMELTIYGGPLYGQDVAYATVGAGQKVTFNSYVPGSIVRWSSLSFTPSTGLFSGSVTGYVPARPWMPAFNVTLPVLGVVTRTDPFSLKGHAAGYHLRTYDYLIYELPLDPLHPKVLQKVPTSESGYVGVKVR